MQAALLSGIDKNRLLPRPTGQKIGAAKLLCWRWQMSDASFRGTFLQSLPSICAALNKLFFPQLFQASNDASQPCTMAHQCSHRGLPGLCSALQPPPAPHLFCFHRCHKLNPVEKPRASTECRLHIHGGGALDWEAAVRWKSWGRGGLWATVTHGWASAQYHDWKCASAVLG